MFDATGRALGSGLFGPGPATNAFLESFTLHTRALLQFLFPKDPKTRTTCSPKTTFENPNNCPLASHDPSRRGGRRFECHHLAAHAVNPVGRTSSPD